MNHETVMLLIDADNVSVDVVEQAIPWVAKHFGGPHVRRAYCTAESAVKHQGLFKRLGVRPIVNLAAGKNSTDIALAVDAIDLAIQLRPHTVVIASSDSDFAPMVARLREKGCKVVGIGQQGKTGDETRGVYDDYEVLVHRKTARAGAHAKTATAAPAKPAPHPKPAARTAAKHVRTTAPAPEAAGGEQAAAESAAAAEAPVAESTAAAAAPAPAKKATRRRKTAAPAPAAPERAPLPEKVQAILAALPALSQGQKVELRVVAERLKEAGLLSRSGSSTKLFGQFPEFFELQPPKQPNHVKALGPALG